MVTPFYSFPTRRGASIYGGAASRAPAGVVVEAFFCSRSCQGHATAIQEQAVHGSAGESFSVCRRSAEPLAPGFNHATLITFGFRTARTTGGGASLPASKTSIHRHLSVSRLAAAHECALGRPPLGGPKPPAGWKSRKQRRGGRSGPHGKSSAPTESAAACAWKVSSSPSWRRLWRDDRPGMVGRHRMTTSVRS